MSNFRKLCIGFGIMYPVVILLSLFLFKREENMIGLLAATMVIVFLIFGIMLIIYSIKAVRQRRKLEEPYIEGTVLKNTKNRSVSTGSRRRRTRYTIVIEARNGEHVKVKNETARPYHNILNVGDVVRYHPGFIYPIELSDKRAKNICVFCGRENDSDVCSCCGNPMLK